MRVLYVIILLAFLLLPVYAYTGDNHDTWPAFFGTDNALKDNGYIVFYDQGASAFDAPRLVAADLLVLQWTPQRNGVGWRTDGRWNVSFIEDANDLELWESPDTGWQDEAGAWGLLDDDISEDWQSLDAETRQNLVFVLAENGTPTIDGGYIDLAVGVPNWAFPASAAKATVDHSYSMVLDKTLRGISWGVYDNAATSSNIFAAYIVPGTTTAPNASGDIAAAGLDFPQILWSSPTLYCFGTTLNSLVMFVPHLETYDTESWTEAVFTATGILTNDYHATWLKMDDTIHVAVVDFNAAANSTTLNYIRRTPNGWDAPVVLLTVDSSDPAFDSLEWPQITVDPYGAIFIYYINNPDWTAGVGGDLQGFYLDASVYSAPVVGNWVQHTDIDAEVDRVLWVVAPDSIPIGGDM